MRVTCYLWSCVVQIRISDLNLVTTCISTLSRDSALKFVFVVTCPTQLFSCDKQNAFGCFQFGRLCIFLAKHFYNFLAMYLQSIFNVSYLANKLLFGKCIQMSISCA